MSNASHVYYLGTSPMEMTPDQAVARFRAMAAAGWLADDDGEQDRVETYGNIDNPLLTLRLREDGNYDLVFGYQPVAVVEGPGGQVVHQHPYEVRRVGRHL